MLGWTNKKEKVGEKMLTSSLEEYIKTMYILKNTENQIRVTDISKRLGFSKPSVNRALNCLKEEGLISYEAYGDIEFTSKGIEVAKSIVKRDDVLKLFLTEVLEVDEETAKVEATNMKHAVSEDTILKLEKYVMKMLDLEDLKCNYDLGDNRCQECIKTRVKLKKK